MGRTFAKGMRAWGICARSGRKMLLRNMVWDGQYPNLLVDPAWYEPKHPQEMLPAIEDPIALANPSPETIAPPTAPVVTLFVAGISEIDVTWTPAESGITDMEEYLIFRSVNGAAYLPLETCVLKKDFLDGIIGITHATFPIQPEQPNVPWVSVPPDQPATYRDLTVSLGSTYCYMVEAVPQGNNQYVAQGPPITSAPVCTTVALQPAALTGAYDYINNRVNLAWTLPSTWVPVVTGFQIWKSINGGAFSLLSTQSGGTFALQDSTANNFHNTYQYFVIATYAAGNALPSATITAPIVTTLLFTVSGVWAPPPGMQFVQPTLIGGGGGAASGVHLYVGGGAGAGGGAFAQATFPASAITGPVSVTIGAGGIGGIGVPEGGPNPEFGTSGTSTSFGALLIAGGGAGANVSNFNTGPAGGVATNPGGGTSATLESGGAGGPFSSNTLDDFARAGGSTAHAGGGGGGGGRSGNSAGNPIPSVFLNPGGNAGAIAGGLGAASSIFGVLTVGGTYTAAAGFPGAVGVGIAGGSGGGGGGFCANLGTSGPISIQIVGGKGGDGLGYGAGGGGGGSGNEHFNSGTAIGIGGNGGFGGPGVALLTIFS